jgi:hypothetical protein
MRSVDVSKRLAYTDQSQPSIIISLIISIISIISIIIVIITITIINIIILPYILFLSLLLLVIFSLTHLSAILKRYWLLLLFKFIFTFTFITFPRVGESNFPSPLGEGRQGYRLIRSLHVAAADSCITV